MPIKDKYGPLLGSLPVTDNPLDPEYDMEKLIRREMDLMTPLFEPKQHLHFKPTKTKPALKPKRPTKALGQSQRAKQPAFTPRPGTVVHMGQRLKNIDQQIQNEKDLSKKTKLVEQYYDLSKEIDRESERVLNKHKEPKK